jgi:hypothetical protein
MAMSLVFSTITGVSSHAYSGNSDIYGTFTQHIRAQVDRDKQAFIQASGCTKWFYKPKTTPPSPPFERIRWKMADTQRSESECRRLYPGGLNAVREDFAKTQTSFSLSLTFYEFALVGDRDDDNRYSAEEIKDIFQALTLFYDAAHPPAMFSDALTARFDTWHKTRNLERLMEGMSRLYEQGYRVTAADRAELDRVMK